MRAITLTLAGAVLAMGVAASSAQAAPSALSPLKNAGTESLVQKTHGWHRGCVWWRGWSHRHLRNGRAVSCRIWKPRRHCYVNRRGVRVCVWRRW
jgi:Spy/CpxP family protein refolding chaperone